MKFLVVGDEMVDRYWIGRVLRLNPEKHSAPLLNYSEVVDRPGGAANVAANVEALGAEVVLVSQRSGAVVKNRLLDESDGVVARFDLDSECQPINLAKLVEAADGCCAVIVSDYGKGAIDQHVVDQIKALDLPTFADVKVRPDRWVEWAEVMFPNEGEYFAHRSDYRWSKTCVVKCGESGAKLFSRGLQDPEPFPSRASKVVNVAGAGDTVTAVYSAAYMAMGLSFGANHRLKVPLHMAMEFAAVAVANPLTCAPKPSQVYPDSNFGQYRREILEELKK